MALLFGLFFLFLIMGMPVAFCMMCSAVLYCTVFGESINMVLTRTIAGPSSFTLMALAFFILAGNIMNNGGVTDQIFGFCKKASIRYLCRYVRRCGCRCRRPGRN